MLLNREIKDVDFLKKVIEVLSCVIHGHSVRALLRNETKFLSQKSNADLITIYIKREDGHKIDFISDKRRLFCKLMDRYKFNKHSPAFAEMGDETIKHFNSHTPYFESRDLYTFLKGTVTKAKCKEMEEEIQFTTSFFFPLQLRCGIKIGFVSFYYTRGKELDIEKLKEMTAMVQQIIEPLYDPITATFYSKCTQIDSDMARLSEKEKQIVNRVIKGMTYTEISQELKISINTLKTHIKSIFSKYGVSSKSELNNRLTMHVKRKGCS